MRHGLAAALAIGMAAAAGAQAPGDPTEDEIVVSGGIARREAFETRHRLDPAAIDRLTSASADEITRRLPSVHVPVNSRGEAIAFLRNAAERQVAIFYDGAAINVPWDNRLDLSLLPAALVGSARSAAAPLAPLYGVNALGALSFSPREPATVMGRGFVGSAETRDIQGIAPIALGRGTLLTVGGSHATRDGEILSDDAALPFSQPGRSIRTSTDRTLSSVFARLGSVAGTRRLSLTAFHVWGDKGIAPEGHLASGARFWRYPDVQHSLVTGNAGLALGPDTELDIVAWWQRFRQTIDSYGSVAYRTRDTREVNRDRTLGTRLLLTRTLDAARLTGSFNLLQSVHLQRDIGFTGGQLPAALPAFLRYRQRNVSAGLDLAGDLAPGLSAELGGGYDRVGYPVTGDKPAIAAADGWTARAAIALDAGGGWRLRANAGRKIRAPTMRELFGQALNRFLINPDLRPERVVSGEMAAEWQSSAASLFLIGFAQDLDGTIDQRIVGRLRQRINLKGSTVLGVEAGGSWQPAASWSLGGSATLSRVRRKGVAAGQQDRLAEKPAALARAFVDYQPDTGFGGGIEVQHWGRAYSADAAGLLVPLRRSTSINAHVRQRLFVGGTRLELFARADNLADVEVEPQLGLPAPGRTLRLGIAVNPS